MYGIVYNTVIEMAVKQVSHDTAETIRAVVTVRIPRGSTDDLTAAATARLERSGLDVTVAGLRAIEPRLSATVTTIEITASATNTDENPVVALSEVPGVKNVDTVTQDET